MENQLHNRGFLTTNDCGIQNRKIVEKKQLFCVPCGCSGVVTGSLRVN